MPESTESMGLIEAALAPLRDDPGRAAVLLDLDGTLAPIVPRPEDAAIPERARDALRRIASRYGVTAIVTGRRAVVAREIVGLDAIAYAGNHGFEVLPAGADEAEPAPAVRAHAGDAPAFVAGLDASELEAAGLRVEDKGPIVALHWRGAADPAAAEELVARIAAAAERKGLFAHRGRMVCEVRPAVAIDKGVAVAGLLAQSGVRNALYAGDDRTDLDAYRALSRLREEGELERIVRVGVRSAEGPAELLEECDLAVAGPGEIPSLLEALDI